MVQGYQQPGGDSIWISPLICGIVEKRDPEEGRAISYRSKARLDGWSPVSRRTLLWSRSPVSLCRHVGDLLSTLRVDTSDLLRTLYIESVRGRRSFHTRLPRSGYTKVLMGSQHRMTPHSSRSQSDRSNYHSDRYHRFTPQHQTKRYSRHLVKPDTSIVLALTALLSLAAASPAPRAAAKGVVPAHEKYLVLSVILLSIANTLLKLGSATIVSDSRWWRV